jgi:hypothetical protein
MAKKQKNKFKKLMVGLILFSLAGITTACVPDEPEPPKPPVVIDEEEKEKEELIEKAQKLGITLDKDLTLAEMKSIIEEREYLVNRAIELGIENPISYKNTDLVEKIEEEVAKEEARKERERLEAEALSIGVVFDELDTNEDLANKIYSRRQLFDRAAVLGIEFDILETSNEELEAKILWTEKKIEAESIGVEVSLEDTLEEIKEKYDKKIALNQEALELGIDTPEQYKTTELGNRILAKYIYSPYYYVVLDTPEKIIEFNNNVNKEIDEYYLAIEQLEIEQLYSREELMNYGDYEKRLETVKYVNEHVIALINKLQVFSPDSYKHVELYRLKDIVYLLNLSIRSVIFEPIGFIYHAQKVNIEPYVIPTNLPQRELFANLINNLSEEETIDYFIFIESETAKQVINMIKKYDCEQLIELRDSIIEYKEKIAPVGELFGFTISEDKNHFYMHIPTIMKKSYQLVELAYQEGLIDENTYNSIDYFDAPTLADIDNIFHQHVMEQLEIANREKVEAHKRALVKYQKEIRNLVEYGPISMETFINRYVYDMWPYHKRVYELIGMLNYANFEIENEFLRPHIVDYMDMFNLYEETNIVINIYENMIYNNNVPEWMLQDPNQRLIRYLKYNLFYENTAELAVSRNEEELIYYNKTIPNFIDRHLGDLFSAAYCLVDENGEERNPFWYASWYESSSSPVGHRLTYSRVCNYTQLILPEIIDEHELNLNNYKNNNLELTKTL